MAAITATQLKALIVASVGDVDPATGDPPTDPTHGVVATQIDVLWALYGSQSLVYPQLQRLYVERDALALVLAVLRRRVDQTIDSESIKRSQQAASLRWRLDQLGEEIARVESRSASGGSPVGGAITRVVPQTPEESLAAFRASESGPIVDPGDPGLLGSPFARRGSRRR